MEIYDFEGDQYIESGEVRPPMNGEIYLTSPPKFYTSGVGSTPTRAYHDYIGKRRILVPLTRQVIDERLRRGLCTTSERVDWSPGLAGQCFRAKDMTDSTQKGYRIKTEYGEIEEESPVKYKILEPISPLTVWHAGDRDCEGFHKEYGRFLEFLWDRKGRFNEELCLKDIEDIAEEKPNSWIQFLVNNGFIKKVKEKFYHVGQRFYNGHAEFILASRWGTGVGTRGDVFLVNLDSGHQWKKPFRVSDIRKITQEEFDVLGECQPKMRFVPLAKRGRGRRRGWDFR